MSPQVDYELLILGAGPAGLSTALHLQQLDPAWAKRMLVIEKAAHPRPKLCGGGLTRLGLELLRDLDFELPIPLPQARVDDVRLQYRDRIVHVRGKPQIAIFHRPEFDAWLAVQARQRGAQIQENVTVSGFRVETDCITVETSAGKLRARAVVGADGSLGISRRAVQPVRRHTHVARLLEVIQPSSGDTPHFHDRFALFDFTLVEQRLQGYFWDFPAWIHGQAVFNRGVYDSGMVTVRRKASLPVLLSEALQMHDKAPTNPQPAGHPIHWFSPRNRFSIPRLLLVGDAAGVDVLFGEGIAPALGYGQVAAQTLQNAFLLHDYSFHDYRRRVLNSQTGRYLLLRWAIAGACYPLCKLPWFMNLVWSLGDSLTRIWLPIPDLYHPQGDQ